MAAATMYVTVSGAGDNSGSSWANAMAFSDFETDAEGSSEAGDIYYLEAGTYTLTGDFSAVGRAGSTVSPISIIGVKSGTTAEPPALSDWGTLSDSPIFACANYFWGVGNYWKVYNCVHNTTDTYGVEINTGSVIYNGKTNQTSGSAVRGLYLDAAGSSAISCEVINTNGTAIQCVSAGSRVYGCYAHDSTKGILAGGYASILNNIIDTCTTGIDMASEIYMMVAHNTLYNGTTGITGSTAYCCIFLNNIINSYTTELSWTTQEDSNFWAYNNLDASPVKTNVAASGVHSDLWETNNSPSFEDAVNGDLRLASGSDCLNAGMPLDKGTS